MAYTIAERIRQNVADQLFQLKDANIAVTISIGIAIMLRQHADESALIHDADAAMYRAKNSGRNRAMI